MIQATNVAPSNAVQAPIPTLGAADLLSEAGGRSGAGKIPAEFIYQAATVAAAILVLMSV